MMSRQTGLNLEKETHKISQAIQDILTTPIGSRIMRREYGSLLPQLIDSPFNEITLLQLYGSLPHRQLRRLIADGDFGENSSLPHRQLRSFEPNFKMLMVCSLPHRQLRSFAEGY